jgi:hypothetical protein
MAMKKAGKMLLVFVVFILWAVVCNDNAAYAYRIKFKNTMTSGDGKVFVSLSAGGKQYDLNESYGVHPGEEVEINLTGWQSGICWDKFNYKCNTTWSGCNQPRWKDKWLGKCENVYIEFRREGCDLKVIV